MSPRKKSKPNPKAPVDGSNTGPATSTASIASEPIPSTSKADDTPIDIPSNKSIAESSRSEAGTITSISSSQQTLNKKPSRKWLGGSGSWRSKAPAVAKIAKESIGVAGGATSELPEEGSKQSAKDSSPKKFLTKRKSSKGDALPASMTKLNVSSNGSLDQTDDGKSGKSSKNAEQPPPPETDEPPLPPDPKKATQMETKDEENQTKETANTWGWKSWWSRPDGYSEAPKATDASADYTKDAQSTPLPGPTPSEDQGTQAKQLGNDTTADAGQKPPAEQKDVEMKDAEEKPATEPATEPATQGKSWFRLWSSAQNAQTNPPPVSPPVESVVDPANAAEPASSTEQPTQPEMAPPAATSTASTSKTPPKASGWAFWSREKPTEEKADSNEPHKQVGEIAVSDTPSQSRPEAAQFNEQEPLQQAETPKEPEPKKAKKLRGRTKDKEIVKESPKASPKPSKPSTPATDSPTRAEAAATPQPAPKQASQAKQEPPNIVLPAFKTTYRLVQKPTYWQQIRQYFLGGESPMPHLHINPAPPRIKRAMAIGVHGYFPSPLIRSVLGQPTGASIRFANMAATAIQEWTEARGFSAEIEKVALEGEGFIADRVNMLWKLLLNWIDQIKKADFILVACHSQGVPVAMMLVAKLIQFGCVNAARIGVCAMAGVNLGPFVEYKTRYLGATAAELFEFTNPKSLVSQMYLAALDEVLRYGVRVLYVGSIDDQLVSLESSTFSTISHPYIYRAVFVDGRIHAPDFITQLVGFALKLRNLGLPDHGLIRELSPALAGSLYTGEGHSRIYEDAAVYSLAVSHALETTSIPVQIQPRPSTAASISGLSPINIPVPGAKERKEDPYALKVKDYESVGSGNQNPYFLPWAMRGLLEEEFVKRELGDEVEQLLGLFDDWRPTGKGLRDVRYRLEGVKSKL